MGQIMIEDWKPDDPATPVLIKPMFEDSYGPLDEQEGVAKEAWEKTYDYCLVAMRGLNKAFADPVTMSELGTYATHFMNGYLSAKTGEIKF